MKTKFPLLFLFLLLIFNTNLLIAQTNTFPATGNVGIGTIAPASKLDVLPANANAITIRPFGAAAGSTGQLQFRELTANGSNYISFKAPNALASNYVLTLPINYGTNGQVLTSNGAGLLNWITPTVAASTSLSNLAATSINQSMLPSANNAVDLGSVSRAWRNIYSSGKVGIGITAPVGRLHLKGNANVSQFIIDANSAQSNINPLIKFRNSAGADLLWLHSDDPSNIFMGINAGRVNNLAFGAINNIFIGKETGFSNTSGYYNTAVGVRALYTNTSGILNTAYGFQALYFNTSGSNNAAHGYEALISNTTGSQNTASGFWAMSWNSSGGLNTGNGSHALYNNSTGSYNSANGAHSLYYNTTGSANTVCGFQAMANNVSGSYNTILGYQAGVNPGHNPSNFTALGTNAGYVAGMSNEMEIGSTSISWIGGSVGWSTYSDQRIKDNIKSNVPGLSFITKLHPVTYTVNVHRQNEICGIPETEMWEGKYDLEKITQTGFLAQEVEQAAKENNFDFNGIKTPKGNSKLYSLQYAAFVVPLVKAVQELDVNNSELRMQNLELRNEIAQIKLVLSDDQQQRLKEIQKSNSTLEQNIPNPFNQSTMIRYTLPEVFLNAQIKIYSSQGMEMKVYDLKQGGKGELMLEANSLSAGIYSYTLIVDGKAADVKQMIVTK